MNPSDSHQERFRERLKPFLFQPLPPESDPDKKALTELGNKLPAPLKNPARAEEKTLKEGLRERAEAVREEIAPYYRSRLAALAGEHLASTHSYQILFAHSWLVDALHRFAFEMAFEELPSLLAMQLIKAKKELRFKETLLERKREMLKGISSRSGEEPGGGGSMADNQAYHQQVLESLKQEIAETSGDVAHLKALLPALTGFHPSRERVLSGLVLFARGGYGRAELSAGSDLDTGYCLDTRKIGGGEVAIYQELFMRLEVLLQSAGLKTAHQYFEIDEDLSRFNQPETIHTIPSILEARPIVGNPGLLDDLKGAFWGILPYEDFLKKKITEFEAQPPPRADLNGSQGGCGGAQINPDSPLDSGRHPPARRFHDGGAAPDGPGVEAALHF